ncbi:MAG: hypothetical protein AAB401_18775 [Acidobacteriota bacterium]
MQKKTSVNTSNCNKTAARSMKVKSGIKSGVKSSTSYYNHNQTVSGLKVKSNVQAGGKYNYPGTGSNHNQAAHSMKVKSNIKAGAIEPNHSQTAVHGLKVRSGVKAGPRPTSLGNGNR